jgi:hypothetical protein
MPTFSDLRLEYPRHLQEIASKSGYQLGEVWTAFLRLSACCMVGPTMQQAVMLDAMGRGLRGWSRIGGLPHREAEYEAERKRWDDASMTRFAHAHAQMMLEAGEHCYRDILGPVHQEWLGKKGQQWGGEFHTPYAISSAMARMLCDLNTFEHPDPVTVQEPACGSGQLILCLVEWMHENNLNGTRIQLEAWDISPAAVDMCLINLTLYGVPARVVHGNTLKLEAWRHFYTPFYPLAHGKLEADTTTQDAPLTAEQPSEPEPVQVAPTVTLPASQQLERLLAAQTSLFALETE